MKKINPMNNMTTNSMNMMTSPGRAMGGTNQP